MDKVDHFRFGFVWSFALALEMRVVYFFLLAFLALVLFFFLFLTISLLQVFFLSFTISHSSLPPFKKKKKHLLPPHLFPPPTKTQSEVLNFVSLGGIPNDNSLATEQNNGALLNKTFSSMLPGDVLLIPEGLNFYVMGGIKGENLVDITFQLDGNITFSDRFVVCWIFYYYFFFHVTWGCTFDSRGVEFLCDGGD